MSLTTAGLPVRPGGLPSGPMSSSSTAIPTQPSTASRRTLSKTALPLALAAARIQTYSDTQTYPSLLSSSSSSSSSAAAAAAAASAAAGGSSLGAGGYGGGVGAANSVLGIGGAATVGPASNIRTIAWSPLGSMIATADARVLRVWNPERPQVRNSTELKPPAAAAASSGPSSTGHGGPSGTSSSSGKPSPYAPNLHMVGTERVAWNPTRDLELASTGSDGFVRFWDVRARHHVGSVKIGGEGFSLAWRPPAHATPLPPPKDSSLVTPATATGPSAAAEWLWSTDGAGDDVIVGRKDDTLLHISRRKMEVVASYSQPVQTNQLAFSNAGRELFLTTGSATVEVVDFPSMKGLYSLQAHTSSCYVVQMCPRGRVLAVGGSDALVSLWDTRDWVCKHTLPDSVGPIRSVSFSFDGAFVCAGSDEGTGLLVAHVDSGDYVYTHPTTHPTPCVAWHPSRYWLAYSGEPQGLKIIGASPPSGSSGHTPSNNITAAA